APATTTAPATTAAPRRPRLLGIDAARGLALIGLVSVHILPAVDPVTLSPTGQWTVFAGRSAALFALLAGVGLALSSGGRNPHRGRVLTADRVGLLVRAALVAALGLGINELMPDSVPAVGILVYYGVFFLLAVPFLGLSAPVLLAAALFFAVAGPVLVHLTHDALPAYASPNPTFIDLATTPGATAAQLLLTGTFPALPYLTYVLAGMALGRLDLADVQVQVLLLLAGIGLAVSAWLVYWALILQSGGYDQLMVHTPELSEDRIDEIITWGPDPDLPTTTWWWLLISGPHTNTPVALLHGLGTGAAALGFFLLLARLAGKWLLPLVAMGSMTLTLYSAHLLALTTEVHYDRPLPWFLVHLAVAVLFAVAWRRFLGQGPLERLVARVASAVRRPVLPAEHRT
ncbi:MAG: heparan-alpha-glucosaminide N-acetyltransferase domain-containing protein, partial [Actinomycetota bacterium]